MKTLPDIDILILTPIPIEYQGIRAYLYYIQTVEKEEIYYEVGCFKGSHHHYSIAVREIGANNTSSSIATEKAINHLQPSIIILFGIAGGIKDVKIGDIVIGERSYDYETGKEISEGSVARPQITNYDNKLIEFARHVNRQGKWQQELLSQQYPSVLFGTVASGNKVVSSTNSPVFKYIKTHLNDSLCLEMEASGFGRVVEQNRDRLRPFLIRGISDLLDGKSTTDGEGGQKLAVQNAAAFLFGFLKELDFLNYKMIVMNAKELANNVTKIILPKLNLETTKKESKTFNTAISPATQEIWLKVQSLFEEELEDWEDEDLKNTDVQNKLEGAIVSNLRRAIKNNNAFAEELNILVNDINNSSNTTNIISTKSNINNSPITVHGDMYMGDIIEKHLMQERPKENKSWNSKELQNIKELISKGDIEVTVDLLLAYTKNENSKLFNEVISIARRWEELQRDVRIGVLSPDEKYKSASKITFNLLSIVDRIKYSKT